MRPWLIAALGAFYLLVFGLQWTAAIFSPRPIVQDEVSAAISGRLARAGLYGDAPWMLELGRRGRQDAAPQEQAILEQAQGHAEQARALWQRVGDSAWGQAAAAFYLHGKPPKVWPPPGFDRDQLELDTGRTGLDQVRAHARQDRLELTLAAAFLAFNLGAAGVQLLAWYWLAPRLPRGSFSGIAPSLTEAALVFLGIQTVGVLAASLTLSGLSAPLRVLVLQSFVYVVGLAWLLPGLGLRAALPDRKSLLLGVVGYWLCLPVAWAGIALTSLLLGASHSVNPMLGMLKAASGWQLALLMGLAVVAAPLFEEVLYRGCIYRAMAARWGARRGMLASAFLFAAVHYDPWEFLPLLGLGLVFAWLTERSGRLAPSMLAHLCWNGATTLALLLAR